MKQYSKKVFETISYLNFYGGKEFHDIKKKVNLCKEEQIIQYTNDIELNVNINYDSVVDIIEKLNDNEIKKIKEDSDEYCNDLMDEIEKMPLSDSSKKRINRLFVLDRFTLTYKVFKNFIDVIDIISRYYKNDYSFFSSDGLLLIGVNDDIFVYIGENFITISFNEKQYVIKIEKSMFSSRKRWIDDLIILLNIKKQTWDFN